MRDDHHIQGESGDHSFGKVELASCFAMALSAYNDTPAQPQTQAMGAARRDPRGGLIPVKRCSPLFMFVALGSGSSVK